MKLRFLRWLPIGCLLIGLLAAGASISAQETDGGSFTFAPDAFTSRTGQTLVSDIYVDTGGYEAGGAGAKILYDPDVVEVIDIEPGNIFSDYPVLAYDNEAGLMTISGIVGSINQLYSGVGMFARIYWRGLNPGETTATFEFEAGSTRDSNIAVLSGDGDVLGTVNTLAFSLSGESLAAPADNTSEEEEETQQQESNSNTDQTQITNNQSDADADTSNQSDTNNETANTNKTIETTNQLTVDSDIKNNTTNELKNDPEKVPSELVDEQQLYAPIQRSKPRTAVGKVDVVTGVNIATAPATPIDRSGLIIRGFIALSIVGLITGLVSVIFWKKQLTPPGVTRL